MRVYLPKRYAPLDDEDIANYKKNYKLLYKGKAGSAYILHLLECADYVDRPGSFFNFIFVYVILYYKINFILQ